MPVRRSQRFRRRPKRVIMKRSKSSRSKSHSSKSRSRPSKQKEKHKDKPAKARAIAPPVTATTRAITSPPSPPAPKAPLSISVIIPCAHEDAHLLVNLINILKQQTVLPKEVIVSLSGKRYLSSDKIRNIDNLLNSGLPFVIKILYHNDGVWASGNKNYAAAVATGDILIVQDADDIPHFQRLEIMKYYFDKYDIVHVTHSFNLRHSGSVILANNYRSIPFNVRHHIAGIPFVYVTSRNVYKTAITNGEIGVLRSVWARYKWDESRRTGEDTRFNRKVEEHYRKTICIQKELIIYNRVPQHF